MTSQDNSIASSQTLMLSGPQLVSPELARTLEDCRKISLNLVSVHAFKRPQISYSTSCLIAHGISSVSLVLIEWLPSTIRYLCSFHSITGSAELAAVTLTLMLYTISLHFAASVGASHVRYPKSTFHAHHLTPSSSGRLFLEFYMPSQQLEFLPWRLWSWRLQWNHR